jgi:hypothetical protein
MGTKSSVAQILAGLEAQIAHFEAQGPFHARQEAFHRAERERCESELGKLRERYKAFKKASAAAGEVVKGKAAASPARAAGAAEEDTSPMPATTLISWVVAGKAEGDSFGATAVAGEVNTRFANRLRRPLNVRSVSVALSRMAAEGLVKVVREGRAHHEALYARRPSKAKR